MRILLAAALTVACSSEPTTDSPTTDASTDETTATTVDTGVPIDSATPDTTVADTAPADAADSAAADTKTTADVAAGDVATGGACTFNRECAATDRCECIDFTCTCRNGARGSGKNGVDVCTSGNDCASSVCVEGSDGKDYCSDECVTATDCGGKLPRCLDVTGLGRICVRAPA